MSAPSIPAARPSGSGRHAGPPAGRTAWRSRLTKFDIKYTPYLLISPFFLLFFVFGMFPLLYNFVVSLRTWRLDDEEANGWAGAANYQQMLGDSDFWRALRNTFGLFVFSSIPQIMLALVIAAVLNRKLRGQLLLRMGVLLPYITPIAASTLVFARVFSRDTGLLNYLLSLIGISPIDWKADVWSSWIAIIVMVDWRWTGYWAVIFLAAMQSVSKELYEAATVDGASLWTQFWRITIPLIRPALVFCAVISTIGGLQLFSEPLLFGDNVQDALGGSAGQFQTVGLYIYKTAWKDFNFGYAAALSWTLFIVIVILAALNALVLNRIGGRK